MNVAPESRTDRRLFPRTTLSELFSLLCLLIVASTTALLLSCHRTDRGSVAQDNGRPKVQIDGTNADNGQSPTNSIIDINGELRVMVEPNDSTDWSAFIKNPILSDRFTLPTVVSSTIKLAEDLNNQFTVSNSYEASAESPGGRFAITIVSGQGIEAKYAKVGTLKPESRFVRYEMTIAKNIIKLKHDLYIGMDLNTLLSHFQEIRTANTMSTWKGSYFLVIDGLRVDFNTEDGRVLHSVVVRIHY